MTIKLNHLIIILQKITLTLLTTTIIKILILIIVITTNSFDITDNCKTCKSNSKDRTPAANYKQTADAPPSYSTNTVPVEKREIFIPGFMEINSNLNLHCVAFSILKVLIPSLDKSDINGVRLASPKTFSVTDNGTVNKFTSFIITLKNADFVQLIIRAKKSYNYLTTKDIELSFSNSEVASALPNRKIFINEVLSPLHQLQYISIKETAKSLGFKLVWHCNGKFLVRKMNGMRAHVVTSVSDLHAILKIYNNSSPLIIASDLSISSSIYGYLRN